MVFRLVFCIFILSNKKEIAGALFLEGLFKQTKKIIDNEDFISRSKASPACFTRNRKFSFKDLLISLMCFTRPSVQTELDRFFKAISKSTDFFTSISKSAFTQSRRKLKFESFIELNRSSLNYFEECAPNKNKWKGKRVVAIDGSKINLPNSPELKRDYGFRKNQHDEFVGALGSFAYDVCNELVLDAQITGTKGSELDLALQHLDALNPQTDILVFDRGYPSHWLIGLLMKKGYKFCFRLSTAWKDAVELMDSKENDIDWVLKKRRLKRDFEKLKEHGIPLQLKGLRLVCIELSSGQKEILATNLNDRKEFGINDLKQLYRMRWSVEEGFKSIKKTLHLEYFTGKTTLAIKQDLYAKVFMLNLSSMVRNQGVMSTVNSKSKRKHKQQVNKTQALAKLKDFILDIVYSQDLKKIISNMIKVLAKRMEIVRPGRSFKRPDTSIRRRHKLLTSKGI